MTTTTVTSAANPGQQSSADATYRKIAWRLLPFLILCYIAAYLDRINVGFAKLHMLSDLGWSEAVYGLGAGLFFIGYLLFEVPSNLVMTRIGARKTISRIMVLWSLISAGFAFVQTPLQFYVLRFLLGAAEAGFFPGVILYLSYWFPSRHRAKMVAVFIGAIPLAGMVGAPVSGLILEHLNGVGQWAGWQWLFVLEALPSLLLGLACLRVLQDAPAKVDWLSDHEKQQVQMDLARDQQDMRDPACAHSVLATFRNARVWHMTLIVFCQAMCTYGVSFGGSAMRSACGRITSREACR